MSENKKPIHSIKFGVVEAAIWANKLDDRKVVHSATISRLYKPADSDTWKSTPSLRRSDLLLAAKALDEAHTYIYRELA